MYIIHVDVPPEFDLRRWAFWADAFVSHLLLRWFPDFGTIFHLQSSIYFIDQRDDATPSKVVYQLNLWQESGSKCCLRRCRRTHTRTRTHMCCICVPTLLPACLGYSFVLIIIKWSLAFTHKGCKPACASFTNIFPEFRSPNLHHSSRKTVKRYQYLSQIRSNKVIKPANKYSIPCHGCRRPIIIVFITIEDAAAAAWAHTCFFGIWNRELGIWNWDSGFWVWVIKIISLICRLDLVPNKSAAWVLEIWILDSGNSGFRQINSLCLPPCVCVCGCGCNL